MALLAGRVLYQRLRQERPLWRKGRDALLREAGRLFGARYIGRKLLVLAVAALALFAALAHGPYRVGASATVQGVVQRVVAAPFEGYIAEATRRAGDEVRQGDVLAVLDTRETELELLRAGNLEVQYRRQGEAMARGDSAAAAIAQAQARQAMAQIQFYRQQIQRSSLRAPFDGVLVSGDLSQQLGEAVKRGQELFKLAAGRLPPVAGRGGSPDRRRGGGADRQGWRWPPCPTGRSLHGHAHRAAGPGQEGKTVFRLEASLTPGEKRHAAPAWRAWGASTSASAATPGSGPTASWTGCA